MKITFDGKFDELFCVAKMAMLNSYSPYSHYSVGAALSGKYGIYPGTNVENASYGLTICAERVAIFNAIAQGESGEDLDIMLVITKDGETSCGACRQAIMEFNPDMVIYFCSIEDGKFENAAIYMASELLPDHFHL